MNDAEATRQDLIKALSELSRLRPEWRLGQTVANVAMSAGRMDASGVWDLEDEEALAATEALIRESMQSASSGLISSPETSGAASS